MAVWRLSDHHSSPIIFAPLSCNQSVQNEILIRQRSPAFVGIWYVRAPFIWILWLTSNHCRLKASHIFLNLIPPAPPVVTIPSDCQVLNCERWSGASLISQSIRERYGPHATLSSQSSQLLIVGASIFIHPIDYQFEIFRVSLSGNLRWEWWEHMRGTTFISLGESTMSLIHMLLSLCNIPSRHHSSLSQFIPLVPLNHPFLTSRVYLNLDPDPNSLPLSSQDHRHTTLSSFRPLTSWSITRQCDCFFDFITGDLGAHFSLPSSSQIPWHTNDQPDSSLFGVRTCLWLHHLPSNSLDWKQLTWRQY